MLSPRRAAQSARKRDLCSTTIAMQACQDFSTHFKALAKELSDDDVEVGAVNCETQTKVLVLVVLS